MNVEWGGAIALDFFFGGIAAGAFILSGIMHYFYKDKAEHLIRVAAYTSACCMLAAILVLFLHLGRPWLAFWVFLKFNPSSAVAWNTVIQTAFLVISILYALSYVSKEFAEKYPFLKSLNTKMIRTRLREFGAPFAVLLGVNHGFLLMTYEAVPLWNQGAIILMAVAAAVITGMAAVFLYLSTQSDFQEHLPQLNYARAILTWTLVAQMFNIILWIASLLNGITPHYMAALELLSGEIIGFWGIGVIIGLVIPLTFALRDGLHYKKTGELRYSYATMNAAFMLAGGFYLRYVIMTAAQ